MKLKLLKPIGLLLILFSCQTEQKYTKDEEQIRQVIGSKIEIPVQLITLKDSILYVEETNALNLKNNGHRIISMISGDCMACVESLNKWDSFIKKHNDHPNVNVYHIITVSDLRHFMKNIYSKINRNATLHIDTSHYMFQYNNLPDNPSLHTFLVDKNNKILLVGNPIHSPALEELYIEMIKKDDK